jgi:hypothetical protein
MDCSIRDSGEARKLRELQSQRIRNENGSILDSVQQSILCNSEIAEPEDEIHAHLRAETNLTVQIISIHSRQVSPIGMHKLVIL